MKSKTKALILAPFGILASTAVMVLPTAHAGQGAEESIDQSTTTDIVRGDFTTNDVFTVHTSKEVSGFEQTGTGQAGAVPGPVVLAETYAFVNGVKTKSWTITTQPDVNNPATVKAVPIPVATDHYVEMDTALGTTNVSSSADGVNYTARGSYTSGLQNATNVEAFLQQFPGSATYKCQSSISSLEVGKVTVGSPPTYTSWDPTNYPNTTRTVTGQFVLEWNGNTITSLGSQ